MNSLHLPNNIPVNITTSIGVSAQLCDNPILCDDQVPPPPPPDCPLTPTLNECTGCHTANTVSIDCNGNRVKTGETTDDSCDGSAWGCPVPPPPAPPPAPTASPSPVAPAVPAGGTSSSTSTSSSSNTNIITIGSAVVPARVVTAQVQAVQPRNGASRQYCRVAQLKKG